MVTVRFFAAAKAATKTNEVKISANTVEQVLALTIEKFPDLAVVLPKCSYLLNGIACSDLSTKLSPEDLLDVLPPFAGG